MAVDQVAQSWLLNCDPLDMATHHWPVSSTRPARSILPSLLKSPTCTSSQVAPVDQVAHCLVLKLEPVDWPTHQVPSSSARPTISAKPSPLKSPTCTSAQVTPVDQT